MRPEIIRDLHWMARRYADMRSSYAPSLLNRHVKDLLEFGYELREPLFARDGMGRSFDGLTDEQLAAAEEDMPRGMQQVVAEQEARLTEFRNAIIEECAKVADAWSNTTPKSGPHANLIAASACVVGEEIAKSIRALKSPETDAGEATP